MGATKAKSRIFRSMSEFEENYFPRSYKEKKSEKPTDARDLGISLAKESLEKIRKKFED